MSITKKNLGLLSAGLLLYLVIDISAIQTPQPVMCDVISLDYVYLGGGAAPRIAWNRGEPVGYKVTLNRVGDSQLHRNGHRFNSVPDAGQDFVGQGDAIEFSKLCQSARDPKFESLTSSYQPPPNVRVFDGTEMTVTITADKTAKTIYARSGYTPAELLAFQSAVVAVVERIVWKAK